MSEKFPARQRLTWCVVVCGACASAAAQNTVEANGPVALSDPPASILFQLPLDALLETPASPDSPVEVNAEPPVVEVPAPAKIDAAPTPAETTPFIQPASEKKQLGPAANTSAGAPGAADSASDSNNLLRRLDPRSNEITKVIGALAVVVGLILLLRTVLRRAGGTLGVGGRPSGVLEILARYPIGRGQQFMLLKLARRIVLVHQNGATMTTLTEMTEPEEVAALLSRMEAGSNERDATRFRRTFSEFMTEHDESLAKPNHRGMEIEPASSETEFVDLTRSKSRLFGGLLSRGKPR